MILTCPACNTRYRVADEAVAAPGGREVRCASCGNTWRYVPEPQPIMIDPTVPAPVLRIEPDATAAGVEAATPASALRVEPEPTAPASPEGPSPAPAARPRRSWAGLAWLAIILVVAAGVAVGVLARDQIASHWPAAAGFYRTVGMTKAEPPGAGLEISRPAPIRTAAGLVIEGSVTNAAGTPRLVPKLRVALRDSSQKELEFKVIDPPVARLLPGETARFKASFDKPSDQANDVAVTFTPG
jgi:predicted Zn finger-like uncharacterized protein